MDFIKITLILIEILRMKAAVYVLNVYLWGI